MGNIQSVRIFQYKIFSQQGHSFQYKIFGKQGYSSTKYSVSRDIPVGYIQSPGISEYKIFGKQGYSSGKYSVSRGI